jgi:hypothetical protein
MEQRPKKYRRHSPAGYAYLMGEKKKKQHTYYKIKGLQRPTHEEQLRRAGISEKDLRALGYNKSKLKRKKR